jgi:hypothetical protein
VCVALSMEGCGGADGTAAGEVRGRFLRERER